MTVFNKLFKIGLFVSCIAMVGLLAGCDDDDDPSAFEDPEVQRVFELLSGDPTNPTVWSVSEVLVDDLDFSSTYPGLRISFQEGTYTSDNGGAIFQPNGAWNFTSSSAESIVLDGDVEIDVLELTETTLAIGLEWSQNTLGTGGRTSSVSGTHVFTFTK